MPLATTAKLLNQVAAGLNEAHRKGVIHRDLKPGNIFMARIGGVEIPKIVDFGLAKAKHTGQGGEVTSPGTILGSLNYISPEQLRSSKDVDHRSDLWSLGIIILRLITGKIPFTGEEPGELVTKICAGPIPVPSELAPELGLPNELDAFFRRALDRDKTQRFQTAVEMAEQFTRIVQGLPEIPHNSTEPLNAEYELRTKRRAVVIAELDQAALNPSFAPRKKAHVEAPNEETTPIEISEGQMLQVVYHGSESTSQTEIVSNANAVVAPQVKAWLATAPHGKVSPESSSQTDSEELLSTQLKVDIELSSTFIEPEAHREEAPIAPPTERTRKRDPGGVLRKGRRPSTVVAFGVVMVAVLSIGMLGAWSYQTRRRGASSPAEATSKSVPKGPSRSDTSTP
jgi:serine/threonine protein kinase